MLSRFTNATAISSADFYGESSNSGGGRALTDLDFTASELIGKISVQVSWYGICIGCLKQRSFYVSTTFGIDQLLVAARMMQNFPAFLMVVLSNECNLLG